MEERTYTYARGHFNWEVTAQGVICLAIAIACVFEATRGVLVGLMVVIAVIGAYGAFKTFVARAYPHSVTFGDGFVEFECYGKRDRYDFEKTHDVRVREYPSQMRLYIRMDGDSFLRGRYWVHAQWFDGGQELFDRLVDLENTLNPTSLRARARRGGGFVDLSDGATPLKPKSKSKRKRQ